MKMAKNKSENEQEKERAEARADGIRSAILTFMEERLLRNIPEEMILEETMGTFFMAEDKAKIFLTIAEDEVKRKNHQTS